MKALVYSKRNVIEWQDIAEPTITGKNQAIVKPLAVARCDLDLPITKGATLFRPQFALGHEFVAEIQSVSDDLADDFIPGQKVAVLFQVSCGTCPMCSVKQNHHCKTTGPLSDFGMGPGGKEYGGALTPAILIPYAKNMLVPLGENDDPVALASLTDNMTDAYRTVAPYLKDGTNKSVLITGGLGRSISLYTLLFAKALGAEKISYVSNDLEDCTKAESLGANVEMVTKHWPKRMEDHDITVDASGDQAGLSLALRSTRSEGFATAAAVYFSNKTPVPYLEMYNKGIHFYVGRTNAAGLTPEVLSLIQDEELDVKGIVSQTATLAEAKDAWTEPAAKLVITQSR